MPFFRPATHLWPPVLLGSQFVFNIGFYAVVPFLAIFLRDDLLLSGGAIGLILGLRTFSQQGMFIVGGALSDRYGARSVILCGCVIRVTGPGRQFNPHRPRSLSDRYRWRAVFAVH